MTATYNSTNKNVVVSFTPPTNPDVANYYLNRAPVSSSGTVGTYTQVATGSAATLKAAGYKFTDAPAAAGTYSYVVLADNAHGDKSPKSNASQATVPAAAIPPATPYSLATSVTNGSNAGNNGNALDTKDSFSAEPPRTARLTLASSPRRRRWLDAVRHDRHRDLRRVDARTRRARPRGSVVEVNDAGQPGAARPWATDSVLTFDGGGTQNIAVLSETGISNANGAWDLPTSGRGLANHSRRSLRPLPRMPTFRRRCRRVT